MKHLMRLFSVMMGSVEIVIYYNGFSA